MNKVILIGRLTKPVEFKKTSTNKSMVSFTLAVKRGKDLTDFLDCVVWESGAEYLSKYAHQGDLISVEGRLEKQERDYNGEKRYFTRVVADRVQILAYKQNKEASIDLEPKQPITYLSEVDTSDLPFM